MNNKFNIQEKSQKFIILLVGIIALIIGILAIFITIYFDLKINLASEKSQFKIDNIFLNILFSFMALGVLYLFYKVLPKINKYILLVISLAISLALGLWWVNYIGFRPVSDQSMIVYCGEKLEENDLPTILNAGEYLNRNPHQLGFALYIMMIFRIIGEHKVIVLQVLNAIYSTISGALLFLICREIFKEELVQKICLILITLFSFYWTMFNVHVYGNIIGLMFGLVAILFTLRFLENSKIYNLIIVGISISLAYLLKSNYEIFALGIIIVLILHFLKEYKKQSLAGVVLVVLCMFSFKTYVYKHVENGTGYSLEEGVPMIAYMYMGIAEPATLTPGWYTADVERIYNESGYKKEKAEEIAKSNLKDRVDYLLKNPGYTLKFFNSKIQTTWLNPTFQVYFCSTPHIFLDLDGVYKARVTSRPLIENILCGDIQKVEERVMDIFQIITFITAGIALIKLFKTGSLKETLLTIIFLGGFVFHIIWETKAIYVIQYFYLLLPFSAYGMYLIFKLVDSKLKKDSV